MKLFKLLSLPLLLVTITQCASYKLEKNPPFQIISATSNVRAGGINGSPGGTKLTIRYTSDTQIKFDTLFFRDKKAMSSNIVSGNEKMVTAIFYSSPVNTDMQMHSNPNKEYGNSAPKTRKVTPFQLTENECVLSYIENNKTKYFKFSPVKKGKSVIMH
jgi:hypothetical protein